MGKFRAAWKRKSCRNPGRLGGTRFAMSDNPRLWSREPEARWAQLHHHCTDRESQARLARLVARLTSRDRGVQESALAELEQALQLLRLGAEVRFLPESQARTADLECVVECHRCFIEVTTMVGAIERSRQGQYGPMPLAGDEDGDRQPQAVLLNAMLARIAQKAKQLTDYYAPVVLSISIPRLEDESVNPGRGQDALEIDVKQVAASISLMLPTLRHLSGVLISLWEVEPLPSRSNIRLRNVYTVERPHSQAAYPRVRLLILNPLAGRPLTEAQCQVFRRLL